MVKYDKSEYRGPRFLVVGVGVSDIAIEGWDDVAIGRASSLEKAHKMGLEGDGQYFIVDLKANIWKRQASLGGTSYTKGKYCVAEGFGGRWGVYLEKEVYSSKNEVLPVKGTKLHKTASAAMKWVDNHLF